MVEVGALVVNALPHVTETNLCLIGSGQTSDNFRPTPVDSLELSGDIVMNDHHEFHRGVAVELPEDGRDHISEVCPETDAPGSE